jgi:hypothetical protein
MIRRTLTSLAAAACLAAAAAVGVVSLPDPAPGPVTVLDTSERAVEFAPADIAAAR